MTLTYFVEEELGDVGLVLFTGLVQRSGSLLILDVRQWLVFEQDLHNRQMTHQRGTVERHHALQFMKTNIP